MRKFNVVLGAFVLATLYTVTVVQAQLTEVMWGGNTGSQSWQDNANWAGGAFPNDQLKIADLSVDLGANLTLNVGATDVTIAQMSVGSLSNPITTDIISSGGRLVFRNDDADVTTVGSDADFNNDTSVNGRDFLVWQRGFGKSGENINDSGDANADNVVDGADLAIWQAQYGLGAGLFNPGSPGIESIGVAGVTNVLNAPIHLVNQQLEIGGTRDFVINGNITYEANPEDNISSAGLRALSSGMNVTINNTFTMVDTGGGENGGAIDFFINNHNEAQGTITFDGVIAGGGTIAVGRLDGSADNLGTVVLKSGNTFGGGFRAGRGNLVVGHDGALGTGTYRQQGPASPSGYNLISTEDERNIANDIVFAQWQTIAGEHSIEFSGQLTQTNNRGIINMLPAGKQVTLSGFIGIWEDDEIIERRFTVDGTGKTVITGSINDDIIETSGQDRGLLKTGTGVLLIDVAAGANNHSGAEVVSMGNLHYASNDSLNVSSFSSSTHSAQIQANGGAVGVDSHPPGQTLATNTVFLSKIAPGSQGGLMLSPSDANVNIDFGSAAFDNAKEMSLAAPETGITYTGTLTPNNNEYRLGGGSGTLTLPNPQLTGAGRSVTIRNGGTVRLQGANSYTGATVIESKYTNTNQVPGENNFLHDLVDPTLEVNTLANGGTNSSIGASSSAAENLYFHAATLKYVGSGSTTDRLFTIGTGGGTIDSSGTGPVVFANTGAAVSADAADVTGTLDDFTDNPNVIYNVSNTRDVVVGMTVSDPDGGGTFTQPPCEASGANCIPAGTTVTGVTGSSIGLSADYPFILKEDTRIVFGPVARTLTLTGSNTQANVLTPVIANSAKGGAVNIVKQGAGTWLLDGMNTATGSTTVEQGTLGGNGGVGGNLTVNSGATFAPGGAGASAIGDFSVAGSFTLSAGAVLGVQLGGTSAGSYDALNVTGAATLAGILNLSTVSFNPAMGNQFTVLTAAGGITDSGLTITGLTGFTKSIVGNSLVITKTAALAAMASVPEPTGLVLMGLALTLAAVRRK